MTLKDLGLATLEEFEAMTDEQMLAYFSKYLIITRPSDDKIKAMVKAKPKKVKAASAADAVVITDAERQALLAKAAEMGFNIKL